MDYNERLRQSAKRTGAISCMGLDPVSQALPLEMRLGFLLDVPTFFQAIFEEMLEQGVVPGAFKPNRGFYERHDKPRSGSYDGSDALAAVLDLVESMFPDTPIILDNKTGDIGKSSANYAHVGLERWGAHAVTVHPYMGEDSVAPYAAFCGAETGKGVYVLNRTSNPGARDFQGKMPYARQALYERVAEHIAHWAQTAPGLGAVVGATSLDELATLARFYADKEVPLLIPGVGSQGGSATEVVGVLRDAGYPLELARINSSSGITHPWHKKQQPCPQDYAKVCVARLAALNEAIGYRPAA